MSGPIRRSFRLILNMVKRDRLNQELKKRLAEHDRKFLAMVIDPNHADGKYHKQYADEVKRIREWFNQQQNGW